MRWVGNSGGYRATGKRFRYWIYRQVVNGRTTWHANRARLGNQTPLWMEVPGYTPPAPEPRSTDKRTLAQAQAWVQAYDQGPE